MDTFSRPNPLTRPDEDQLRVLIESLAAPPDAGDVAMPAWRKG
jgi:hypothetical protein